VVARLRRVLFVDVAQVEPGEDAGATIAREHRDYLGGSGQALHGLAQDGLPERRRRRAAGPRGEYSGAAVTVMSATVARPCRAAVPSRHGNAVRQQRERSQPQSRGEQSCPRSGLQPGVVPHTTPSMQARIARCGPFRLRPARPVLSRSPRSMCSIFGIFGLQPGDDLPALRRQSLDLSQRQRHRGPDWSGVYLDEGAILVHERLAIVDPAGGAQPLLSSDGRLVLAVNGEIYNHRELKAELTADYAFQTGSDCEAINALYLEDEPASFLNRLNGIFAFALWDKAKGRAIIA